MTSGRLAFTNDDVLICLENASELRKDALKTTTETELTLLTLCIEEAAKGFVVVFERRLAAQGIDPSSSESLAKVADSGVRKLLERHKDVLTPTAVRQAFHEHPIKQRHLTFVADFCLYLAPTSLPRSALVFVLTPNVPLGLRIRAFFWYLDHRDGRLNYEDRVALARLDSIDFAALEKLRQRALYVDLRSPAGGCLAPIADENVLSWLEDVAELLVGMLEGVWILNASVEKADKHSTSR
jgi:hypothetical protein